MRASPSRLTQRTRVRALRDSRTADGIGPDPRLFVAEERTARLALGFEHSHLVGQRPPKVEVLQDEPQGVNLVVDCSRRLSFGKAFALESDDGIRINIADQPFPELDGEATHVLAIGGNRFVGEPTRLASHCSAASLKRGMRLSCGIRLIPSSNPRRRCNSAWRAIFLFEVLADSGYVDPRTKTGPAKSRRVDIDSSFALPFRVTSFRPEISVVFVLCLFLAPCPDAARAVAAL